MGKSYYDATRLPGPRFSILLITRSYPPVVGGTEIEAQRVGAALQRLGHRVQVLAAGGPPMPATAHFTDPYGVPVRLFGAAGEGRWRDYAYAWGILRTLWRVRHSCDIVYFLMPGIHVALGVPFARLLGKPVIMKFSGSNEIRKLTRSWVGRRELDFLRRWARRILLLNSGMEAEAVEAGFSPSQWMWMPNPVDTGEYQPLSPAGRDALRRELHLALDTPAVIYVGRLAPEKELPSLLGAMARVVREQPAAKLVLVGDGPSRQALETQVRELDLQQHVIFTGAVPGEQVRRWLQAGDLFALVSSLEGFPCSLAEAMAAGLPAVVSDIPGTLQLIDHQKQGLVVPLRDEAAMAAALLRMIGNRGEREAMGQQARQRALDIVSSGKVVALYEKLFGEILRQP